MNILEIKDLHKRFGDVDILRGLKMNIPEHSIFGFLGQNGAGKTTTMKIILGLLKADSGSVMVYGEKVIYGDNRTNRYIGYLPDVPSFYGYMKPMEYLLLCGEITGLSKNESTLKAKELLCLVGLNNENKRIKSFSRGMKQRLGIAQALLNDPKILICDEPTSALDPIGRKDILDILLAIKGKTTVIFSTHILSDIERICDYIAILHKGKLAVYGTLLEIKAQHKYNGFNIQFSNKEELQVFKKLLILECSNTKLSNNNNTLTVTFDNVTCDGAFLIDLLSRKGIVPLKFEKLESSLESLFQEVVI